MEKGESQMCWNRRFVYAFVGALAAVSAVSAGEFTGQLEYEDGWFTESGSPTSEDDPDRVKMVKTGFGYTDNTALNWEVTRGELTDGASIPAIFRWLIGDKFLPEFARPSALHDHYVTSENRLRSALATHRMFRDALQDEKVEMWKVRAMYAAVVVFGPTWTDEDSAALEGQACALFNDCVRSADDSYGSVNYVEAVEPTEEQRAELTALLDDFPDGGSLKDLEIAAVALREKLNIPTGSLSDVLE